MGGDFLLCCLLSGLHLASQLVVQFREYSGTVVQSSSTVVQCTVVQSVNQLTWFVNLSVSLFVITCEF